MADDRVFYLSCATVANDRDGCLRTHQQIIRVPADFSTARFGTALTAVIMLLWLDAGPNMPWTPSAIDQVELRREHDTLFYARTTRGN